MLLTLTLLSVLHAAAADPVPGTWRITGDVVGNAVNEVCTIKQSGTALTGSCVMDGGKPYELTGEVKDGKITFQHGGEYDGQTINIIYTAEHTPSGQLRGTILVQPFDAAGVFTATPVPEKQ